MKDKTLEHDRLEDAYIGLVRTNSGLRAIAEGDFEEVDPLALSNLLKIIVGNIDTYFDDLESLVSNQSKE